MCSKGITAVAIRTCVQTHIYAHVHTHVYARGHEKQLRADFLDATGMMAMTVKLIKCA
jgi:hypothetical protein